MKCTFLKTIAFCILFGMTNTGLAGIIYDFNISSQTLTPSSDFTNYMIVAEFKDTTDFAAVTLSDILNFGYSYEGVDYLSSDIDSNDPSKLFTLNAGELSLDVGNNSTTDSFYLWGRVSGSWFVQVGQENNLNLYISGSHGISAHNPSSFNSFVGVARSPDVVPEPSTLAIFALGMIGLASRRFKKQY